MIKHIFPVFFREEAGDAGDASGGSSAAGDGGGLLGGDGGQSAAASDGHFLSEEYRADPSLKDFTSADELAKAYKNTKSMLGNRVPLADRDDPDFEAKQNELFQKLGRPDTSDQYQLNEVEGSDRLAINEEVMKGLMDKGHELGLSQRQMAGLHEAYLQGQLGELDRFEAGQKQAVEDGINELKQEYGAAFPDKVAAANDVLNEYGSEDLKTLLNDTGLANSPEVVRLLANVAHHLKGDVDYSAGRPGEFNGALTPAQALEKISTLQADADFMAKWTDKNHTGHAQATQEMRDLYKYAYPGS